MRILFFAFTWLFPFTFSWAALPPFYQSVREYETLLHDPQLASLLGSGEAIRSIERTETGFLVKGTRSLLNVQVVYDPQAMPGPAKFHLIFEQPSTFPNK